LSPTTLTSFSFIELRRRHQHRLGAERLELVRDRRDLSAFSVSSCSLSITSRGVLAGANTPTQKL